MIYLNIEQKSQEWWDFKVGKVSGTRFGQLISSRENLLIDEMASEILDNQCDMTEYINDDMQFGIDNEHIAIDLYEKVSGLKFQRGGVIKSDYSDLHMASPDAVNVELGIVVEAKCTRYGKKQINRFRNGIDADYKSQVINYFACSDTINEVHFISYCPYRAERPLVIIKFNRDSIIEQTSKKTSTIKDKVAEGRLKLISLKTDLDNLIESFTKVDF